MPVSDTKHLISQRAHQIWEQEGRPEGRHEEHWLQAERDILAAAGTSKKANKKASKDAVDGKEPPDERAPAGFQDSGAADDLTRIKGIGKKVARKLNAIGVVSFAQIAGWKREDVGQVSERLGFKGRIKRQAWVKQAKKLVKREGL